MGKDALRPEEIGSTISGSRNFLSFLPESRLMGLGCLLPRPPRRRSSRRSLSPPDLPDRSLSDLSLSEDLRRLSTGRGMGGGTGTDLSRFESARLRAGRGRGSISTSRMVSRDLLMYSWAASRVALMESLSESLSRLKFSRLLFRLGSSRSDFRRLSSCRRLGGVASRLPL